MFNASSRTFSTNRKCEQRIPKNEGMRMKAQAKILRLVHENYRICEQRMSGEAAHLRSLARAFANHT